MAAPDTAEAQATTSVESSLAVTYADGKRQTFKLAYRPLFFTGDRLPDGAGGTMLAGGYYDIHGKPILDHSAAPPAQFYSDCPDGYSLLQPLAASVPGVLPRFVTAKCPASLPLTAGSSAMLTPDCPSVMAEEPVLVIVTV